MISLILNSDDLEQQCEEALFEVCDARERYPLQCTKELENCIKLTNEICVGIICRNIIIISYIFFILTIFISVFCFADGQGSCKTNENSRFAIFYE